MVKLILKETKDRYKNTLRVSMRIINLFYSQWCTYEFNYVIIG